MTSRAGSTGSPERFGPYRVVESLGGGAEGHTYKATDEAGQKTVAVKVLSPSFAQDEGNRERFEREAEKLAHIRHPNIVPVLENGEEGDSLFLVREWVEGPPLKELLRKRSFSLQEALAIFKGICKGLQAAHAQEVLHRSLNPSNVLVCEPRGIAKLIDFGLVRVEMRALDAASTMATGQLDLATLHYMAPEARISAAEADRRADLYSAGAILYEMLTGKVPLGKFSLPSQLNSDVPPEVDPIVLKCLESDPSDRYPSVDRLLRDLERLEDRLRLDLVNELRGISRSTSRIFRRSTGSLIGTRGRLIVTVVVLLLLAVLALLGFRLLGGKSEAPATEPSGLLEEAAGEPQPVVATLPLGDESPALSSGPVGPTNEPPPDEGPEAVAAEQADEPALPAPARGTASAQEPRATPPRTPAGPTDSSQAQEAFRIARRKIETHLYGPALGDLRAFVREYPDSPLASQAYLLMSQAHRAEGRPEESMAALVELETLFPDSLEAAQAHYLRAGVILEGRDRDRKEIARRLYDETFQRYPNSPWAPLALAAKAAIEMDERLRVEDAALGESVPSALVTYRTLVERYPGHQETEKAYWHLGELYRDLDRFEEAAGALAALGTRFPESRYDAWWEAGEIYRRKLDQPQRAEEAYARVPQGSPRYNAAQKRLKKLDG